MEGERRRRQQQRRPGGYAADGAGQNVGTDHESDSYGVQNIPPHRRHSNVSTTSTLSSNEDGGDTKSSNSVDQPPLEDKFHQVLQLDEMVRVQQELEWRENSRTDLERAIDRLEMEQLKADRVERDINQMRQIEQELMRTPQQQNHPQEYHTVDHCRNDNVQKMSAISTAPSEQLHQQHQQREPQVSPQDVLVATAPAAELEIAPPNDEQNDNAASAAVGAIVLNNSYSSNNQQHVEQPQIGHSEVDQRPALTSFGIKHNGQVYLIRKSHCKILGALLILLAIVIILGACLLLLHQESPFVEDENDDNNTGNSDP